jgi:DNA-directed RNA polymerase subunit RPC12/RpoP
VKRKEKPTAEVIPLCDDCGVELERYYDAADTGNDGWRCPNCGSSRPRRS